MWYLVLVDISQLECVILQSKVPKAYEQGTGVGGSTISGEWSVVGTGSGAGGEISTNGAAVGDKKATGGVELGYDDCFWAVPTLTYSISSSLSGVSHSTSKEAFIIKLRAPSRENHRDKIHSRKNFL